MRNTVTKANVNTTVGVGIGQPMVEHGNLIDIFSIVSNPHERKKEKKLTELLSLFNRESLKKALETLEEKEIVKRMNTALRERGYKIKLRESHIPVIKKLLEE